MSACRSGRAVHGSDRGDSRNGSAGKAAALALSTRDPYPHLYMPRRTIDPSPPEGSSFVPPASAHTSATGTAGSATAGGTRRYAERMAAQMEDLYRTLPRGLTMSALGMGTYLGDCTDEDDAAYADTVRAAVASGVNVLDTAINYRCQRSERAVGRAVVQAIADGVAQRDELVICSKGGYVALDGQPPASREEYDAWIERELVQPGIVARDDLVRGGHSIAPSYLAHQLAQSRANLRMQAIDVYYVHNPEEQLLAVDRATFRTRLRAAFALLEERVAAGEIRAYGCATWNGFRVPPEHRQHLPLAELVAIAREVGGTAHHFQFVELPVSLAMPEAARVATQPLGRKMATLLEAAHALGIGVVASAPLMQGKLTRDLPDAVRELFPECTTDAQRALRFTTSLPGVCVALAGMRRPRHLRENLDAWRA